MMKCMAISAFVLGLSATVGMAQDIGGHYAVAGTNINGSPYAGEAMVTLTSDTTCQIEWITGDVSSYGICMRYDNAFATGYLAGAVFKRVVVLAAAHKCAGKSAADLKAFRGGK